MSDSQDRNTGHPEWQRALNRLLALTRYSLASYLAYAPSWTCREEEPLLEAVRRIAAGHQAETVRVGRLLVRRHGHAESGRFPTRFTGYNDLALDYLGRRLIEHERLMIDEIGRCAEQLAGDPEAGRMAEEVLAGEKRRLGLLTRLAPQGAPQREGHLDEMEVSPRESSPAGDSPGRTPPAAINPAHGQPPPARRQTAGGGPHRAGAF
jgi:hypothetical protein